MYGNKHFAMICSIVYQLSKRKHKQSQNSLKHFPESRGVGYTNLNPISIFIKLLEAEAKISLPMTKPQL